MAWTTCYDRLRGQFSPLKKFDEIDWSTVPKEALENDTFAHGEPFYIMLPEDICQDIMASPYAHAYCQCKDINGNPFPVVRQDLECQF